MATEHVFTKGAIYTDNDFAVRVLSRKGDFVKFMNLGNNQTFRRKISVTYVRGESYEVVDIRKNWDKGFPVTFHVLAGGILPEFSEQVISRAKEWFKILYADDETQPDENATAEITPECDNDNALASQPATATTAESETKAQPEIVKFVVGKSYGNGMFSVVSRSAQFITFKWPSGKTFSRKTTVKEYRESVIVKKHRRSYLWTLEAEPDTFQKIAHAEIAQTVKYAFIPGKVYAYRFSYSFDPHYCKITAKTDKTICYVKHNCNEITRAKLRSDNHGEYFYVGKSTAVHADDFADAEIASRLFECTENTPNPHDNNTPAEIAQPEFISPYERHVPQYCTDYSVCCQKFRFA